MMSPPSNGQQPQYSSWIAFVYVFNLVIGVGALALPKAFAQTGWLLGLVALGFLGLMSYCTATFMIEAMAIANGLLRCNQHAVEQDTLLHADNFLTDVEESNEFEDDETYLVHKSEVAEYTRITQHLQDSSSLYDIEVKVEMGEMAKMFFNNIALVLYYIVIALYLYGDLAIYAAAVPKSMTTVICGSTDVFDHDVNVPCHNVKKFMVGVTVLGMYRIMLAMFTAIMCPFVFLNISKTKFLQVFTSLFRWVSFSAMIILAVIRIANKEDRHKSKMVDVSKLPNFFGAAIYSFMCQHSLPSILTPVHNKKYLNILVLWDFVVGALFYTMVLTTAVFAFREGDIADLYTLNFSQPVFLRYFLELFPVFTLSTNFPIIGITLRENLKCIFLNNSDGEQEYGLFVRRYLFPLLTVIPPLGIAYATHDVGMLVNFTGAYAGAIIQYIVPVMLVYCGRKSIVATLGSYENKHAVFQHVFWIYFVVGWYVICLVFVTVNIFNMRFHFLPS